MELKDFSATDASQTIFVEGMSRAQVNNDARSVMGALARHHLDNNGSLATGGTSTAITVTLNQSSIAAWYDGLTFAARITTTCGATPTINPTGSGALGAKSLYWSGTGTQLAAGDLTSTAVAWFMYEATSDKVYVFAAPPTTYAPQTLLTTRGDIITRDASVPVRLAIGAASTVLRTDGTDASWGKVAGAHIAMGSDAQGDVLYHNGTSYARLGAGTSGQFLKTQGTSANPAWANTNVFVAEVSLSGGAGTTFSSIPAGVRRITVNLRGVSLDDTDSILIQLGTSGGLVATGYASTSTTLAAGAATTGYTTGFGIRSIIAANTFSGHMVITHVGGNVWVAHVVGKADSATTIVGGGDVSLGAELDRLAILDTGADNFDAGTISIMYEF